MPKKNMGRDTVQGHQSGGTNLKTRPDENDVAPQQHGNNQLQAQNQADKRNERRSYPDSE